eukprot:4406587-Pleurochrysis_carterae.AAC.5
MPSGAAEARASQKAVLAKLRHQLSTSDDMRDAIEAVRGREEARRACAACDRRSFMCPPRKSAIQLQQHSLDRSLAATAIPIKPWHRTVPSKWPARYKSSWGSRASCETRRTVVKPYAFTKRFSIDCHRPLCGPVGGHRATLAQGQSATCHS